MQMPSITEREIFALFRKIVKEEGTTILMAAHDPLVNEYVDGVLQLSDGHSSRGDLTPRHCSFAQFRGLVTGIREAARSSGTAMYAPFGSRISSRAI
jgi:energy-coupling factor transporter ATP-binding protein EcfA2